MKIIQRHLSLDVPRGKSVFLWGPRKAGKSYLLAHAFRDTEIIDLLQTDVFAEYAQRPSLLRERYGSRKNIRIAIDEVQKVPAILDEVHWLIENAGISFLLTGSSARKLRRGHANLLGGRAWRKVLLPLSYTEVKGFDLEKAMISGCLPPHLLSPDPIEDLRAYVADYLKEEIAAEALTQNIPAFGEFLRVAALTSSELINYVNVARETGVSHKVVRNYFDIMEDTFLGFRLDPWTTSKTRRMIQTSKWYLFDVGVTNFLARRRPQAGSAEFGKSFEQFIAMELRAYQAYRQPDAQLSFWRTSTGREVDFIFGEKELAVEVKASAKIHDHDAVGLCELAKDGHVKHRIIVSLERQPRTIADGVHVLPWAEFLDCLWAGKFL